MNDNHRTIIDLLRDHWHKHNCGPTVRSLAESMNKCPSTIHSILKTLERRGLVENLGGTGGWSPVTITESLPGQFGDLRAKMLRSLSPIILSHGYLACPTCLTVACHRRDRPCLYPAQFGTLLSAREIILLGRENPQDVIPEASLTESQRIRRARLSRGLSQVALARKVGLSPSTIVRAEGNGNLGSHTKDLIFKELSI